MDLQGWGECITSAGFGDLYGRYEGVVDNRRFYSDSMSGM